MSSAGDAESLLEPLPKLDSAERIHAVAVQRLGGVELGRVDLKNRGCQPAEVFQGGLHGSIGRGFPRLTGWRRGHMRPELSDFSASQYRLRFSG